MIQRALDDEARLQEWPHFTSAVGADGREVASGEGGSIKESEQAAERAALEILGVRPVPCAGVEVHVGA